MASAFNYIVSAHDPTLVTHALRGPLRCGRGRVPRGRKMHSSGATLSQVKLFQWIIANAERNASGRVATASPFKLKSGKDVLVLTTDTFTLCVLEYQPDLNTWKTVTSISIADASGRPSDRGQLASIDAANGLLGISFFWTLKIIPLDKQTGAVKTDRIDNVRLEELHH